MQVWQQLFLDTKDDDWRSIMSFVVEKWVKMMIKIERNQIHLKLHNNISFKLIFDFGTD